MVLSQNVFSHERSIKTNRQYQMSLMWDPLPSYKPLGMSSDRSCTWKVLSLGASYCASRSCLRVTTVETRNIDHFLTSTTQHFAADRTLEHFFGHPLGRPSLKPNTTTFTSQEQPHAELTSSDRSPTSWRSDRPSSSEVGRASCFQGSETLSWDSSSDW